MALCLIVLISIFQPFSNLLYQVGLGGVVFCALIFNLVPLLHTTPRLRSLIKPTLVIAISFLVVTGIAILTALAFTATFQASGPG